MIQSMRTNNKINKVIRPQEDIEFIYQAIQKNKEHLESFCERNNMKLPPVIQSRYGNFSHLTHLRQRPLPSQNQSLLLKKHQSENAERDQNLKFAWIQKKPSICKIMFSKADRRKSQQLSVHCNRLNSNGSNESILRSLHHPKRLFRSQERMKDFKVMGEFSTHQTTLHHFIEGLNFPQTHRQSTGMLSQSLDAHPAPKSRYQLLSINRMCTINPEAELMRTLRGRNLAFEKSARQSSRRQFQGKQISRISFYKNADGIIPAKKNQSLGKKEISMFEPWQGALQEQDFLSQMVK